MNSERVWRDFDALPLQQQRQVADFIAFLLSRSGRARSMAKTAAKRPLTSEPLVGLWRDREDMQDSSAWVRNLRAREWAP